MPSLMQAIDMIREGFFSSGDKATFQPLIHTLFAQQTATLFCPILPTTSPFKTALRKPIAMR